MIQCILGCFLVLIGTFAVGSQDVPTFFIGVLDNQNGAITNGARLAVEEINNAGGVRGVDGVFYGLELVIEPTNFGESLDDAINNLRIVGVIAAVGPVSNEEVLNGLPVLQSLDAPILTAATDDTILTSDTTDRIFRARASDIITSTALASFIVNEFGLREIITIQLDVASTAAVVGFNASLNSLGVSPGTALLTDPSDIGILGEQLIEVESDVLVVYGSPALAGALYNDLRAGGWQGLFVYNQASDPNFKSFVATEQLEGIISATSWSFTSTDRASTTFLNAFIRTFGALPDAVEATAYDGVKLIAQALQQPGDLRANLAALNNIAGVQGILRPADLSNGEISDNVAITRLGRYGAPEVLARYARGVRLPPDQFPIEATATPSIEPSPTLDGVFITITGARQNVRSGPSLSYPILGQLVEGDRARVIGATADNEWVVIDFRGLQGWLAVYLLEVIGDLNSVPIVTPPPTPTIGITPTPVPPPEADIVIDGAVVLPSPIAPTMPFNVSVTVRNAGNSPAGLFVVAANFPPNNIVLQGVVPGLAPGQSLIVGLSGTLFNTGYYTTNLIADANNQVPEGAFGESNNGYVLSYAIDKSLRRQAGQTLNLGDTIDLEGDAVQGDANWNSDSGIELDALNGAKLGILPGIDLATVHYDLISPSAVNRDNIPRSELAIGTLIGIITADGNRGVMRVDAVSDTQLVVAFKLYNN
jgi:ABC-type branched-subunit amino acid transport system substrate-binding protein